MSRLQTQSIRDRYLFPFRDPARRLSEPRERASSSATASSSRSSREGDRRDTALADSFPFTFEAELSGDAFSSSYDAAIPIPEPIGDLYGPRQRRSHIGNAIPINYE